jgi:lysophospholipase L1-like esterase
VKRIKGWLARTAKRIPAKIAGPVGLIVGTLLSFTAASQAQLGPDTHVDPAAAIGTADGFVAIGDSYSAGEGLQPYLNGTEDVDLGGNRCHRSNAAHGAILGASAGAAFHFVACSGAVAANVFISEQEHDGHPVGGLQADGLPADAAVVTLTMGGNDVLFAEVVKACAIPILNCVRSRLLTVADPATGVETKVRVRDWAPGALDALEPKVRALYDGLRDRFDTARIVVLGYPRLFTEEPSSAGQGQCGIYQALWSDGERRFIRDLQDEFNGMLARQAVAAGIEYVDSSEAFAGHETCGPKGQWLGLLGTGTYDVRGQISGALRNLELDPSNFHPTPDGQRMMSQLIGCYLAEHTTDPYTPAARAAAPDATTRAEAVGDVAAGLVVEGEPDAVLACALGEEG